MGRKKRNESRERARNDPEVRSEHIEEETESKRSTRGTKWGKEMAF
jgi:hypothetical protein